MGAAFLSSSIFIKAEAANTAFNLSRLLEDKYQKLAVALSPVLKQNSFLKRYRETSCSSQSNDCCTLSLFLAAVWIAMSTLQVTSTGLFLYQSNLNSTSTHSIPKFHFCYTVRQSVTSFPSHCCLPEPCQLALITATDPTHRSNCQFNGRVLQWSIFKYEFEFF